jgi:hypothetical protein
MPEWVEWFAGELKMHRGIESLLGIGCSPVVVKATKEQLLEWLSGGVESGAITLPTASGAIEWPSFALKNIFVHT